MKRESLYPFNVFFAVLLLVFSWSVALAQSGNAELSGAKPTATKGGAKGGSKAPAAPVTPTLAFNQDVKGRLDPRASAKTANGGLMEEYMLKAKSDDWLTFTLQSSDPNLSLQIVNQDKAEVAVVRDAAVGGFKIKSDTGALPSGGEYSVRVVGANGRPLPYTLRVNRLGLTGNVYNDRFSKIYFSMRENDPASVDEAIKQFEELASDDAYRPTTFEQLGILYLSNKHNVEKAEQAMTQAIKLNGAGIAKITFDSQWREMEKSKSDRMDWPDARSGWLRIRPGELKLTDLSNKELALLKGEKIKALEPVVKDNFYLVAITTEDTPKPFIFAPGGKEKAEADLIIKFIQAYMMNK